MWQLLGAALRYRRVPSSGFKRLTSKQGNKNYYKGKGVQSTGHHTKLGALSSASVLDARNLMQLELLKNRSLPADIFLEILYTCIYTTYTRSGWMHIGPFVARTLSAARAAERLFCNDRHVPVHKGKTARVCCPRLDGVHGALVGQPACSAHSKLVL